MCRVCLLVTAVSVVRWFFGQIKRVDAEKLLMMDINDLGSHLVRESESVPGTNIVTYGTIMCII